MAELSRDELDFLVRVRAHRFPGVADRKADRLRQKMRRKGYVEFNRGAWRWELTHDGREVLEGKGDG